MPGRERRERVRPGSAQKGVAVGAGQGRAAGVEARVGPGRLSYRNGWRQHLVDGPLHPLEVGTGVDVGADHLAPGVNAGVGPPRTGQLDRVAKGPLEGVTQRAGHRVHAALDGETMERGPQVGD